MEVKLNPNCTCPHDCPNHGSCVDCITKHMQGDSSVHCMKDKN